jgi:cobalt-zinc-cadmium resistance protein CzcA
VGLIALFGMAVQHGTVLVSFIDELRARGMPIPEAVREASLRRLRPLLMTKLTSVLGLIPILFTAGPGSDIQKPLAMVVLGGLAFTTLLNTYVVPALYGWFHKE